MTAAPITARSGYHAIGAHVIPGVAVTAATAASQAVYHSCNSCVCSIPGREYSSWLWGGYLAVLGTMQQVKVLS